MTTGALGAFEVMGGLGTTPDFEYGRVDFDWNISTGSSNITVEEVSESDVSLEYGINSSAGLHEKVDFNLMRLGNEMLVFGAKVQLLDTSDQSSDSKWLCTATLASGFDWDGTRFLETPIDFDTEGSSLSNSPFSNAQIKHSVRQYSASLNAGYMPCTWLLLYVNSYAQIYKLKDEISHLGTNYLSIDDRSNVYGMLTGIRLGSSSKFFLALEYGMGVGEVRNQDVHFYAMYGLSMGYRW